MNHFDAVDFSECHSEEVISFFDAQFSYRYAPYEKWDNHFTMPQRLYLFKLKPVIWTGQIL